MGSEPTRGSAVTQALCSSLVATHRSSGETTASSARSKRRCTFLSTPSRRTEVRSALGTL
jgi:hypothetical protein